MARKAECVLLADPHHGLSDAVRSLLATTFEAVVIVADEVSLFESAGRLQSNLAVVDLALSDGNGIDLVRRLRGRFPHMKMIILSVENQGSVSRSALDAGADGFVIKSAIATDLLVAADAVLKGDRYVSPRVAREPGA